MTSIAMNTTPSLIHRPQNKRVAVYSAGRYVKTFMKPLEQVCEPMFIETPLTAETAKLSSGCYAVNVFVNDDLSAPVLDSLRESGVKIITLRCAGFDRLDIEHAKKLGFLVFRVPAYSPRSVAELALTHTMALSRNLQLVLPRTKTGNYTLDGLVGSEVSGKVFGIVGTGKIAQEFIKLIKPMASKIIAYDVYESEEVRKLGVEYTTLAEVLQTSDIVSLHCPLTKDTHHLLDIMTMKTMKRNAVIINTARGGLIDTDDLITALEKGYIAGAAIDVYENESGLFFTDRSSLSLEDRMLQWDMKVSRLMNLPNVIVSPHIAFLTTEALKNIVDTTAVNLDTAFEGHTNSNAVY